MTGNPASLIISAVVVVVGIVLIACRRPLERVFDRVWSASSRPGSGPLIPTNARFFAWAGVMLIVGALVSAGWTVLR